VKVDAKAALKAKVSAKRTAGFGVNGYKLIVVGSTKYIADTDIKGNHQVAL
jgi:hypothetical protein